MKILRDYVIISCCNCGMDFAITADFDGELLKSKRLFYCVNGHPQSYTGETEQQKLDRIIREKNAEIQRAKLATKTITVEKVVEKPHEPKNFTEILEAHEHEFKKTGKHECKICGLYQGAYQLLTP